MSYDRIFISASYHLETSTNIPTLRRHHDYKFGSSTRSGIFIACRDDYLGERFFCAAAAAAALKSAALFQSIKNK